MFHVPYEHHEYHEKRISESTAESLDPVKLDTQLRIITLTP